MISKNLFRGIFLILSFFLYSTISIKSQVTIGVDAVPEDAALLVLKDQEPTDPGGTSATKGGLLLPRVNLEKETELFPFFSNSSAGDEDYEKVQKLKHKGLYVYNLTSNDYFEPGIYYWDSEKWNLVQKGVASSIFTIDNCATDVKVVGTYSNNVSLDASNYLIVKVNVTKVGSYIITAMMDSPDNGYYFTTQGVFYTTGVFDLVIPGTGTPIDFTPKTSSGDRFNIYLNNSNTPSCSFNVKVLDSSVKPNFTMVCNTVRVRGVYKKDVKLTDTNIITFNINVLAGSAGAEYHFETDEIEGMKFEATGILGEPGPMTITMTGTGAPMTTAPKEFTISSNSALSPNATCKATMVPVISAKKIIALGDYTFGLTSGGTAGCNAMLNDLMNYGDDENSIIKYEGFASLDRGTNLTNLARYTGDAAGSTPYDIIVITYNLTPTDAQRALLVNYVNKGGVLIYLDQNNTGAAGLRNVQLIADIFEETGTVTADQIANIGSTCNQVIKMNTGINDEISNGPFGDVRNSQWGEDYANSCGLKWVPRGAIVYAGATNAITGLPSTSGALVTMLRHPTKSFFWCGDSGLIHGGSSTGSLGNQITTPFAVGSRVFGGITYPKYPIDRMYADLTVTTKLPTSNSTIFANVMAWALNTAEVNGINSGK